MNALTSNVAQLYHTLESSRTISFMITNGYLDSSAQKAFINGINVFVEQVKVIHEVIQHAKSHHKTTPMTWVYLVDPFGSLSHMLIQLCKIIKYIDNFYKSSLTGHFRVIPYQGRYF